MSAKPGDIIGPVPLPDGSLGVLHLDGRAQPDTEASGRLMMCCLLSGSDRSALAVGLRRSLFVRHCLVGPASGAGGQHPILPVSNSRRLQGTIMVKKVQPPLTRSNQGNY